MVENAFAQLKGSWRILMKKSNMYYTMVPDIFVFCCMLHNIILDGKDIDVEQLMQRVRLEAEQDMQVNIQLRADFLCWMNC